MDHLFGFLKLDPGTLIRFGLPLFFAALLLMAFLFLITGIHGAWRLWQIKQYGEMTRGEVVRTVWYWWASQANAGRRRSRERRLAVIRFVTPDGQLMTFTTRCLDTYSVGQSVPVLFIPQRPTLAEVPQVSIFSGYRPTIFERLLIGIIVFPSSAFFLSVLLPRLFETISIAP